VLATLDDVNLEPGDEIAHFDGDLCVGMGKLTAVIDFTHILLVKASLDDGTGNGYTPGHTIVNKYWDVSAGKEIEIISAYYYSNNPVWSASGNFEKDGRPFVELTGKSYVTQTIDLSPGWNLFTIYLIPENPDMKAIFQSLIDDGSLIKVQDDKGNSMEDWGIFGGWTNNIGNISLTEGYKVKVSKSCQLVLQGLPATLPMDIPLEPGWNIMGFPLQIETDGMNLMQQLIDRHTLVKVMDEKGNSIADWGIFGGWTNGIGDFIPGEGYKVKVNAQEKLTISESSQVQVPTVTTDSVTGITQTMATGGGVVTFDGGATVTARGVCWATTQTPTTADNKTTDGTGTGSFSSSLTSLTAGTTYYVRAYATNSQGTAYGEQVSFTTSTSGNPTGTFTDSRDGKTYKWAQIGDQTWMAENLAWLPSVSPPDADAYTEPYYYVYDYSGTDVTAAKANPNYTTYGVLYNWPAALRACPAGWHLPNDAEWTTLTNYLINNGYGYQGSGYDIAKSVASTTNWDSYSTPGTPGNDPGSNNSSGFSGLPGGVRDPTDVFRSIGYECPWWSSAEYSSGFGRVCVLYYHLPDFGLGSYLKEYGLSVRCLRD
ncbi:MAG: hypothetical protein IH594_03270, partial [Bacteroidales bacterium]|nr:hypothetical protein [Bacteroidales bacterium]